MTEGTAMAPWNGPNDVVYSINESGHFELTLFSVFMAEIAGLVQHIPWVRFGGVVKR